MNSSQAQLDRAEGALSLYVGGDIRTPRNTHDLVDNSLCQRWSKAIYLNIYRKILLKIHRNATIIKKHDKGG